MPFLNVDQLMACDHCNVGISSLFVLRTLQESILFNPKQDDQCLGYMDDCKIIHPGQPWAKLVRKDLTNEDNFREKHQKAVRIKNGLEVLDLHPQSVSSDIVCGKRMELWFYFMTVEQVDFLLAPWKHTDIQPGLTIVSERDEAL